METKLVFLKKLKAMPKNNLRQWQFWYKVIAMLFIFGVLFSTLIIDLVYLAGLKGKIEEFLLANPTITKAGNFWQVFNQTFGKAKGFNWITLSNLESVPIVQADYGASIINHFSYFTVLSNFAIAFWFLFAVFQPHKEGKSGYLSYRASVILATFITITMIIWLGLLMPTDLASGKQMSGLDWFFGLTEHALFPLLFIGYVVFVLKVQGKVMDQKTYMQKEWKNIIFILLGYGIYCLIRGEIRYQGNQPAQYPYFFLNVHATNVNGMPGIAWFFVALILIAGISMAFSSGYNWLVYRRNLKLGTIALANNAEVQEKRDEIRR